MLKTIHKTNGTMCNRFLYRQTSTVQWITFNNHPVIFKKCNMILNRNHLLLQVQVQVLPVVLDYYNEYWYTTNSLLINRNKRLQYHTSTKNYNNNNNNNKTQQQPIGDKYVNNKETQKQIQKQSTKKVNVKQQRSELNKKITNAQSCNEILNLIEHTLTNNQKGGGDGRLLDHVGFSVTFHRLARFVSSSRNSIVERNTIINDTRFSLLFVCLAEALVSDNISTRNGDLKHTTNNNTNNTNYLRIRFGPREMVNIVWAIAKLDITIPSSELPMLQTSLQHKDYKESTKSSPTIIIIHEASQTLEATAQRLRERVAISTSTTNIIDKKLTIQVHDSELLTVASQILDYIGIILLTHLQKSVKESYPTNEIINLQACSNLQWSWATADRANPIVLELITVLMTRQINVLNQSGSIVDTLHPQNISNSLWAMATANLHPGSQVVVFIELVAQLLLQNDKQFVNKCNSQNLSNSAWAISKLVIDQQSLMKRNELNEERNTSSTVDLTKRMQISALTIINIVAMEVIQRKAAGFKAQHLSNIALAFARVDTTDIVLIRNATQLILEESIRILPEFNNQNATNLVWSVAQVFEFKNSTIDTLFQRVGKKLLDTTIHVHPQGISMTLNGFTKQKFMYANLYRKLASRFFSNKESRLEPQWISNVMWALATANVAVQCVALPSMILPSQSTSKPTSIDPVLHCCAVATKEFIRRPNEFNTQEMANLCWSLATLGVKDTTFLKTVEKEVMSRICNTQEETSHGMAAFTGQNVANILWSFAILNYVDCNLLEVFEPYIIERCKHKTRQNIDAESIANFCQRQNLTNIAWACAAFGKFPDELMTIIYRGQFGSGTVEDIHQLSNIYGDGGLAFQAARQWAHVQIAMGLAHSDNQLSLPSNFPDEWLQRDVSNTSEMTQLGWTLTTSKLQKDISNSFKSIGFNHVMEHTISMNDLANEYAINVPRNNMNVISIDIANVEKKIAIEVDGPSHFLYTIDSNSLLKRGKSYSTTDFSMHEPNGSTMLKRRLLTSMDWTVLTVPYWEWNAMKGSHEQEQYCHRLLQINSNM